MKIATYETREQLSAGKKFSLYRAVKESDAATYVLKVTDKKSALNFVRTDLLALEFRHLRQIDSEYVVKAIERIQDKDFSALVLADINGRPLKEYIKQNRFEIDTFFELAMKITHGLAAVHRENIIHKDINPTNIIWNPQTGKLNIIDFNIASQFDVNVSYLGNPEKLQGTLPYISPEQTGRMNRRVDYRTDFYSLGVTFYEMLTATLPFTHNQPMELIYAHLARTPKPPHRINEQVPHILSDILLKLTAKKPEDRYQSADGLLHDLERARKETDFVLGEQDFSGKLHIPEKLYGRESEIQQLMAAYDRVSGGGWK